ncbi:hypothetical protein B0H63DRAFT_491783 [Podospora didyma]|uniref:threonine--tRNA ligase n=1 Tax=Podospora didyma TaxID=330526 RepID=A0AAE0P6S7_9PEZI|nr:hypothetical protein B0H63DRAFT_491783 [Podospora didyma]
MTRIGCPGSPVFLPHGARIFNRLVEFLRMQYVRYGFEEVITPTMYKKALWAKSGHLDNYADDMFTVTSGSPSAEMGEQAAESSEYGLKPMNCPGHCLVFASNKRTANNMPYRYADFSALHRNELSGALSGLTRVRRFHQDDGHIFCRPIQIEEEIGKTLDFIRVAYGALRLGTYRLTLSTRPAERYMGSLEEWEQAEGALKRALDATGQAWTVNDGDGAFYGPKIDIIVKDSDGKEHQTATIQLDFQLPKRFNLEYMAPAPEQERLGIATTDPELRSVEGLVRPVMIHRAVLGSVERLMALLIEQFDGKWPFWLNPRQATICTVNDTEEVMKFARHVHSVLMGTNGDPDKPLYSPSRFFVDVDDHARSVPLKVRAAKLKGYGLIVVVGPRDVQKGTVTVDATGIPQVDGKPGERSMQMTPEELLQFMQGRMHPPPDYITAAASHGMRLRQSAPVKRGPLPLQLPILDFLESKRVILASASPRRKALLAQFGLRNAEIVPSSQPEDLDKKTHTPEEYVQATARRKCLDVYESLLREQEEAETRKAEKAKTDPSFEVVVPADPALVIAADTVIVTRGGHVLEKPRTEAEHIRMLQHLRDTQVHRVLTAVCVVAPKQDASHPGYELGAHLEETRVHFAQADDGLPDDVIEAYVRTREGADKAGGYAVQGVGGLLLIDKLEGGVDNVVGLPVRKTMQLCEKVLFQQGEDEVGSDDE